MSNGFYPERAQSNLERSGGADADVVLPLEQDEEMLQYLRELGFDGPPRRMIAEWLLTASSGGERYDSDQAIRDGIFNTKASSNGEVPRISSVSATNEASRYGRRAKNKAAEKDLLDQFAVDTDFGRNRP